MELILGRQPPVPELGLTEAEARFTLVFREFVRACADPEHPLVLFLDDPVGGFRDAPNAQPSSPHRA